MKRNFFLQLISVLAVVLYSLSVKAEPVAPAIAEQWAEQKGQQLLTTFRIPDVEERFQKLDSLFLQYIDLDYISRFVMGRYWRVMTPEQKQQFQNIFRRYALAMYKTLPLEFADKLQYQVGAAGIDGEFTNISADVSYQLGANNTPQTAKVWFKLHQTSSGIKLVDISLEQSSLILAYRQRFAEMITKLDGEIEWFIEDLNDLAVSAEAQNQAKLK